MPEAPAHPPGLVLSQVRLHDDGMGLEPLQVGWGAGLFGNDMTEHAQIKRPAQ